MVRYAVEEGGSVLQELNQRVENGANAAQITVWLSAVARAEATPAPEPQSDPEPTPPSAPQQGPQIIANPQN